jgi:hypothetical protein
MRPFLVLTALVASLAPAGASERHYDVRLVLDPATRVIDARMLLTLPDASERRFALGRGFALQALSIDGRSMDAAAESWPLPAGRAVEIAYRATLPPLSGAQARLMPFVDPEGSFVPLVGWHPGLATGAFTYAVTVDVPAEQRAVVPGRLVEERETAGRYVARFVFDKPARELSVFVGPYAVGETMHGRWRLRTYFPPAVAHLGDRYRAQVGRYLDAFSAAIGPYPHDEFHVVASPLPVGLGFPTLTYVSRHILPLPFMQERSLAHEVLHAWWGHAVAVEYQHGNWCEALTTFMADYALAEASDEAAARDMRRRWLADFAVLPAEQDHPVRAFVARGHTASQVIGYNKGAMLFVMLRDEIGPAAFEKGIQRFWREHQFRVASWNDLRAAFEAEAGRPLDRFFRQWLERTGAPQLGLQHAERTSDGKVAFTLRQSPPPYRLAVPVAIETAQGPERHVVRLDTAEQRYTLAPAARATALRIDPDDRLFRRLAKEEVAPIIRSLIVAPNAVTVIADGEPEVADAARAIASHLLEAPGREANLDEAMQAKAPILVIGTTQKVAEALARAGLERPLGDRGTARAWMAPGEVPLLVVEGRDANALRDTIATRHYGASSYLVFEGRRVVDRGVWPPAARPLQAEWKD